MANRNLTNERILARQQYVDLGITSIKELADVVGVEERTIARWIKQDNWESQRENVLSTPLELESKLRKVLSQLVGEIADMQSDGVQPSPEQIKRAYQYTSMLRNLNDRYDERGMALIFTKKFIEFCANDPDGRKALPTLKKVLHSFLAKL